MNILEHHYVPIHEKLTDSETKKLIKSLEYDVEELPKIKSDDPAVKAINSNAKNDKDIAKAGDILRIIRDSETAGEFITYRLIED